MDGSIRLDNYGLHHSALLGDEQGVLHALQAGADVNSLDEAGRTVLMCVVAGENWRDIDASDAVFMNQNRLNALETLLTQPEMSLLTLNAPHASMNGVIPLGMAAWLNQPLAVRTLLDGSVQSVAVDGMDSHGATALMYAARDGNLEVAKILLSHGARPDFRDYNHRTSIQFALPHPNLLWLCENVLRRHRWRESKTADRTRLTPDSEDLVQLAQSSLCGGVDLESPPLSAFTKETTSQLTDTLISSICSGDLPAIHSLLFSSSVSVLSSSSSISPAILVNNPDNKGWSPIHHCVTSLNPSTQVLDALYCAGADVSLFTTYGQQTPLHILAHSSQFADLSHSLATFIFHLIQDLRAPLSARDTDDETCIHIAAEHGKSLGMLTLLLQCDVNGTVRKMKNSRGLTPEDVCRREYLSAFRPCTVSPGPILSDYIQSTESLISPSEYTLLEAPIHDDASSIHSTPHINVDAAVEGLLSSLCVTCPSLNHARTPVHIQRLEDSLYNANDQCSAIVMHFRARIEEATQVLQELESKVDRIDSLRNIVCLASRGKILARELTPLHPRRRQRDSKDSLATLSSEQVLTHVLTHVPILASNPCLSPSVGAGTQTGLLDFVATISMSRLNDDWIDVLCGSSEYVTCKMYLRDLWNVERELTELKKVSLTIIDGHSSLKLATKMQNALKKKAKLEAKIISFSANRDKANKQGTLSGPSRVKAWLKRIVTHEHQQTPRKVEIVLDVDEGNCNVGREPKTLPPVSMKELHNDPLDATIDAALRTSQVVLDNASHDLESIHNHLAAAQLFINLANHSISRTQRVFKRAVKKREGLITDLRTKSSGNDFLSPDDIAISARTSLSSISTIYSTASSVTATPFAQADEDTRQIRRLLLRKIEAQISGAWDEVDKITIWLQIIKEAVRGVKRRAYL